MRSGWTTTMLLNIEGSRPWWALHKGVNVFTSGGHPLGPFPWPDPDCTAASHRHSQSVPRLQHHRWNDGWQRWTLASDLHRQRPLDGWGHAETLADVFQIVFVPLLENESIFWCFGLLSWNASHIWDQKMLPSCAQTTASRRAQTILHCCWGGSLGLCPHTLWWWVRWCACIFYSQNSETYLQITVWLILCAWVQRGW